MMFVCFGFVVVVVLLLLLLFSFLGVGGREGGSSS